MIRLSTTSHLPFGISGLEDEMLGTGWGASEDGFRWMLDDESVLEIPGLGEASTLYLILRISPLILGETVWPQRLAVLVDGFPHSLPVITETTFVIVPMPGHEKRVGESVKVVLKHPDWLQLTTLFPDSPTPPDSRKISLRVHEAYLVDQTGSMGNALSDQANMARTDPRVLEPFCSASLADFASLGDNCEFGLFQRRCGVEPQDLFRFSRLSIETLLTGLEDGFVDLCNLARLAFSLRGDAPRREYITKNDKYKFFSHSGVVEDEASVVRVIEREIRKLYFLRQLLIDDLKSGDRLFVFKANHSASAEQIDDLSWSLRRWGDNFLLHIKLADGSVEAGHVERTGRFVLTGYIDSFLDYSKAQIPASEAWPTICDRAGKLWCQIRANDLGQVEQVALEAVAE